MLEYKTAKKLYDKIVKRSTECENKEIEYIIDDFYMYVSMLAGTCYVWKSMSEYERAEYNLKRQMEFGDYVESLMLLCDTLEIEDMYDFLPDIDDVRDFACYFYLFRSLERD